MILFRTLQIDSAYWLTLVGGNRAGAQGDPLDDQSDIDDVELPTTYNAVHIPSNQLAHIRRLAAGAGGVVAAPMGEPETVCALKEWT